MKYYSLLLAALIIISCSKDDKEIKEDNSRDCLSVEYGTNIDFQLEDEVCFPDGNTLTLTTVEHNLCPCDAICVWAGDLLITLTSSNDQEVEEIKSFYPTGIEMDRSIFANHEISTFTYTYDGGVDVPPCVEDFDAEKMLVTLSISPL